MAKKQKKNLFERVFDSIFWCAVKIVALIMAVIVSLVLVAGTEGSFSLDRASRVVKKQRGFISRVIGEFGGDIVKKIIGKR